MTGSASWHRVRERGSLLGMRFVVWLYRCLGRRACSLVILPIVGYFYITGGESRRASRLYLERLHRWSGGRLPRRHPPGWWDGFLHYREFGLNILDRVGFWLGDARSVDLVVHGREHLTRLREAGRGAVLVSAHLGSFDALRLLAERAGVVVNVVMYLEHARMINAVFKQLRPGVHLRTITPRTGSVTWLLDARARVAEGEMLGILGDRVGPYETRRISWVPFLGVPARFSQAPFLLAARLGCPILLVLGLRRDRRTYEIFVEPLGDRPLVTGEGPVRAFVGRLEAFCARAPYQWFNFYDLWAEAPNAGLEAMTPDPGMGVAAGTKPGR